MFEVVNKFGSRIFDSIQEAKYFVKIDGGYIHHIIPKHMNFISKEELIRQDRKRKLERILK